MSFLNTGWNAVFGDPGAGQRQAATDVQNNVVPGFQNYGNQAWGQQMQGLSGALGAMDPSQTWFDNSYGSSGPGSMENAFQNYGQNFMSQPSQAGAASDAYGQYMQGNPMTYDAMNRASGMAGGQVNYGQYSDQLNGGGDANHYYNMNQGQYAQPGAGESFYGQNQAGLNRETNANTVYDQFSSQLYGPGRAESFQPQNVGVGGDYAAGAMSKANGPGTTDSMAGEIGNYARNANDTTQYAQSQMGQLAGPGAYENFVNQDINGTNPALQQETQEGLAGIDQEMAARGQYNSGGASTAIGKFLGTQSAKDYANRANLAQQAQQMQMSRIGQGTQTAQASSQNQLAQGSALQSLGGQQDTMANSRQGLGLQAAGLASTEGLANQRLGLDSATAADQSRNARLQTLQGMSTAGDQSQYNQMQLAGNLANQSQQDQLARLQGGMGAAQGSDAGSLARLQAQFGMGQSADQQNLQRGQFQFQMGQGADATNMARYGMMGQLGNMADTQHQNQLINYMNAAQQSQAGQRGRMADAMGAQFGISQANQNQYSPFYNQGGQMSGQMYQDAMNALANSYGLNAQGMAATNGGFMNGLGTLTRAYGATQGGGGQGG